MTIAIGSQITTVSVQNMVAVVQTDVPLTFGQVFKEEDLPPGSFVELRSSDNTVIKCQLDVKRHHHNGNIRHAIISAIIPQLPASTTVEFSIVRASSVASGSVATPANFSGLDAVVNLVDNGSNVSGPIAVGEYSVSAAELLASNSYTSWLSGPVASDWIIRAPLKNAQGVEHPDLHCRFHIRAYKGINKAKIDYVIENSWAKKKEVPSGNSPWQDVSTTEKYYKVSFKVGNNTVYTRVANAYHRARLENRNAANSLISITSSGATGLANDATQYDATLTIDGVERNISITGSSAQTYGQLKTQIESQLGGLGTVIFESDTQSIRIQSASATVDSSVVIAYGTLFPALKYVTPYRPIFGGEVIHYPRTRWKKTFWWGSEPAIHIIHNKQYLIESKAVPNYPLELTGSLTEIAKSLATMKANEDIGQNGITKAVFSGTGAAPGIGLLPEWTAMWIVSQNPDAKYNLLKQADLAGGWPGLSLRDYETDRPIDFERWPYATFSSNAGDSYNSATGLREMLPPAVSPTVTISNKLRPDVSHHPDFYFVPYLITGDYFYLEGLLMHQRYNCISNNAHKNYRDGRKCLVVSNSQVRGQAWAWRTLVHTLYIVPDNDSLKADLEYQLYHSLAWYNTNYVEPSGAYHNAQGYLRHSGAVVYENRDETQEEIGIAPWQDDFFTSACGRAYELGFTEFKDLFEFKSKFPVGRLTNSPDFCWQGASIFSMDVRDTNTSPFYTTWKELYDKSMHPEILLTACGSPEMAAKYAELEGVGFPNQVGAMTGYPSIVTGYPANLQPAVAYAATFDVNGGEDAWLVFDSRAAHPNYNLGPQFAIEPRVTSSTTPPEEIPEPQPGEILMAIADRIKETSTTAGTGAFTLSGASSDEFRRFIDGIPLNSATPYVAVLRGTGEWEIGIGTLTSANTLTRTPTASSNGGQLVNFSSGIKDVSCDITAAFIQKMVRTDDDVVEVVGNFAESALFLEEGGVPKRIKVADFLASVGTEIPNLPTGTDLADGFMLEMHKPGVGSVSVTLASLKTFLGAQAPADVTAPVLSNGVGTATGTTTANGTVYTNEANGTLYYLFSTSSTATAAAVKAASNKVVTATGTQNVSVTGLIAATTYYVHYLHRDAAGNDSAVFSSPSFATTSAGATATGVTMTGPTGGNVSTASTNFTIGVTPVGSSITGTVVVTPSDNGGGGSFIPATVSLTTASPTATFTYTPSAVAGARTISVTNNGSLSNPANIVYTTVVPGTTAPTLTNPAGTQTGSTTANGTVITNEANGTLFRYISTNSVESAGTVIAANLTSTVTASGTQNVSFTGLTASTTYYVHFVHRDNANNTSAVVSSAGFATAASTGGPHTITPYTAGNVFKTSIARTESSGSYTGLRWFDPGKAQSNGGTYWNITPNVAAGSNVRSGWGTSNTTPPAEIAAGDNSSGTTSINGLTPMYDRADPAWQDLNRLWVRDDQSGPFYQWIEVNGNFYCLNASAGLMVT